MNTMVILVKREFWEHRSLWIAPLVWVGILLVLFSWGVIQGGRQVDVHMNIGDLPAIEQGLDKDDAAEHVTQRERAMRNAAALPETRKQTVNTFSYLIISALISGFATIVVFFYLVDCLYAERRDRSILFWKSLPLSDTQVVLSKLATAMLAVPAGVIVLSAVTQFVMYCIVWLRFHGTIVGDIMPGFDLLTWMRSLFIGMGLMLGGVLWYAPIAAYFLLLSVWARRLALLWAVIPVIAIPPLEKLFLDSTNFLQFLGYRLGGYMQKLHVDENVFKSDHGRENLPRVDDVFRSFDMTGMFTSIDMWLGLAAAAAMIYAVIRIRRYRDDT